MMATMLERYITSISSAPKTTVLFGGASTITRGVQHRRTVPNVQRRRHTVNVRIEEEEEEEEGDGGTWRGWSKTMWPGISNPRAAWIWIQ
jgi:hypothetical protein